MNQKLYTALRALLIAVVVVSAAVVVRDLLAYRAGDRTYEDAARTAGLVRPDSPPPPAAEEPEPPAAPGTPEPPEEPDTPEAPDPLEALAAVDLEALRAYNPEVAGWIEIPDTGISYPLMQGANNQWYLKHTWTGEPSSVGAIFIDSRNSRDLGDFHTIVYGHRLRSGAMFAPLRFYEDDAYRQEHPSVYIADDAGLHRYDIFAVYAADVKDRVYQELDVEDEETRQAFIRFCLDSALADTGVTPEAGDRILTLSTCTGDGYAQRWVVQAVLRPEAEEGPEEGGGAG